MVKDMQKIKVGHQFLFDEKGNDSKGLKNVYQQKLSAKATISVLESVFATHGLPEQLVTDNGTSFASEELKQYTCTSRIKNFHKKYCCYVLSQMLQNKICSSISYIDDHAKQQKLYKRICEKILCFGICC